MPVLGKRICLEKWALYEGFVQAPEKHEQGFKYVSSSIWEIDFITPANPCPQASGIICVRVSNSSLKQKKISILKKKPPKSRDPPGKMTVLWNKCETKPASTKLRNFTNKWRRKLHHSRLPFLEQQQRKRSYCLLMSPRISTEYHTQGILSHFSRVWLFVTFRTVASQAPLSMGFPRQEEYWSGMPLPSPIKQY